MRILIVEDDPTTQKLYEAFMIEFGEVTTANDGKEGYNTYCDAYEKGEGFDLIFMDIMMPEVDGLSAVSAIRDYEIEKGLSAEERVPVIMISAMDDTQSLYQAEKAEVLDYIVKPITRKDLLKCFYKCGLIEPEEDSDKQQQV